MSANFDPHQPKNAVIKDALITIEGGGYLTAWLNLDYGGPGPGFGGHTLYLPKPYEHHELKSPAGYFIYRVMQVAGVKEWSQLPGQAIRVSGDDRQVYSIGHIVQDDWFRPDADFRDLTKAKEEVMG